MRRDFRRNGSVRLWQENLLNTPQRVVVLETVERKPTPNSAGVERKLPPADLQFEVAVIHLAPPGTKHTVNAVNGHEVQFRGATMQFLIMYSYNEVDCRACRWNSSCLYIETKESAFT